MHISSCNDTTNSGIYIVSTTVQQSITATRYAQPTLGPAQTLVMSEEVMIQREFKVPCSELHVKNLLALTLIYDP